MSHGNLSMAAFYSHRSRSNWWEIVPWSNYLITAVVPCDLSAQHLVRCAFDPLLGSSAFMSTNSFPWCPWDIKKNTSIATKIYYALIRNRIEPTIEKMLRKNQNGFWRNLKKVFGGRTLKQHYYSSTSPRHLTPYTEGTWNKCFSSTAFPKKPSQP